jgi:hypothetical protein
VNGRRGVAVLFSGGTDSTASAALLSERFGEVHLLTLQRAGFKGAENSAYNAGRLARRFPDRTFVHRIYETTALARHLTSHRRLHFLRRYGFMTLQACGFCALSNQVAGIAHCIRHGLTDIADGITHDWPFFPAHMDKVIDRFRDLNRQFGIEYHTPVLHCDVDRPMTFMSKVVTPGQAAAPGRDADTTGRILHSMGLSETENYKGTELDKRAQARCFQFVLPNIYVYWVFRGPERFPEYESVVLSYFGELMDEARRLLEEWRDHGKHKDLFAFLDQEPGLSR